MRIYDFNIIYEKEKWVVKKIYNKCQQAKEKKNEIKKKFQDYIGFSTVSMIYD